MARVHIVERPKRYPPTSLCGRIMIDQAGVMGHFIAGAIGGVPFNLDNYLDMRRRSCSSHWVSLYEFIYEGDDSPDCATCRRLLDAAIKREFWP